MFGYWFRWTCVLILNQQSSAHAVKVASAVRLSFLKTEEALRGNPGTAELDGLHADLDYDYTFLTELLRHAGPDSLERKILTLDFQAMKLWYKLAGTKHALLGKFAIAEMSSIVRYFASELGQGATA